MKTTKPIMPNEETTTTVIRRGTRNRKRSQSLVIEAPKVQKTITRRRTLVKPVYPKTMTPSKRAVRLAKVETIPKNRNTEELKQWIENHYSLKECFLIPREQRAYVQPHKWPFTTNVLNTLVEDGTDRVAIEMAPSVNRFLSIGLPGALHTTKAYSDGETSEMQLPSFKSDSILRGVTFDEDIHLVGTSSKVRAGLADGAVGYKYLSGDSLKYGCKMYQGSIPISWNGKYVWEFKNQDNSSMDLQVTMLRQLFDNTILEEVSGAISIPGNTTGSATVNATVANYTDIKAFGWMFSITNPSVIGNVPSGCQFKVGFERETEIAEILTWRDFTVWDIITDTTGALRQQYESSSFHCFTALHATMSNTQASIYKGGSIQAAQIAGNTSERLPHTFDGLNSWLGSRAYDTNENKSLTTGLHWNYRWEKVQDTFFITKDAEEHESKLRPELVVTMIAPPRENGNTGKQFSFTISGTVMLEYITEVRDAPVFLSPPDTCNVLARYCAVRAEMPCVMENPSHWETLKSNVTRIMKHPVTKEICKDAAKAALKFVVL